MSSFWNFLFGVILILLWIVAGGYITQANVFLTSYRDRDEYLHRAYWLTFWGAFVTWTLIGIFIILVILSVLGVVALFGTGVGEAGAAEGAEAEEISAENGTKLSGEKKVSWFTIAFLVFALILISITGILAAISASSMVKSSHFNFNVDKLKRAYDNCVIAASMCIGAAGVLIIGIIIYLIVGTVQRKKIKSQEQQIERKEQIEIKQIQEAKFQQQQELQQKVNQARENILIQKVYQQAGATPPVS